MITSRGLITDDYQPERQSVDVFASLTADDGQYDAKIYAIGTETGEILRYEFAELESEDYEALREIETAFREGLQSDGYEIRQRKGDGNND